MYGGTDESSSVDGDCSPERLHNRSHGTGGCNQKPISAERGDAGSSVKQRFGPTIVGSRCHTSRNAYPGSAWNQFTDNAPDNPHRALWHRVLLSSALLVQSTFRTPGSSERAPVRRTAVWRGRPVRRARN